jgi:hypothetical protein
VGWNKLGNGSVGSESEINQLTKIADLDPKIAAVMPHQRNLYYGGKWQEPRGGYVDTYNPATGESLGPCAEANAQDIDNAARAAQKAFRDWRRTKSFVATRLGKCWVMLAGRPHR